MKHYDPTKHGAVVAIRIYLKDYHQPMAELAFAFGGTETIPWDVPSEREKFAPGINGYTLIYDERPKREFKDWAKPIHKMCLHCYEYMEEFEADAFGDVVSYICPLCGDIEEV